VSIFILSHDSNTFPPSEFADDSGLLAIGGDLSIERLLNAYANGIFPWYNPGEVIQWWCPKERFIIFPSCIHVSRKMRKIINKNSLQTKINSDFPLVINNCKMMRENETWITAEMEFAYNKLFEAGYALCVSVYDNETLVGGLYGVTIGKCFFGESMFTRTANASKLALIHLCETLSAKDFLFVDCQFHTEHLESMGGQHVPWDEYKRLLKMGLTTLAKYES